MKTQPQGDLFGGGPKRYPDAPGWKEPTTSRAAAEKIAPTLNGRQQEVLREIGRAGPAGLTPDEAAARVGRTVLAVRPRFSELGPKHLNLIEKTGERRKNESGLEASAWRERKERR